MKILVIIDNQLMYRNFISTSAFSKLNKKHKLIFFFNNQLRKTIKKKNCFFYSFNSKKYQNIQLAISTIFFFKNWNKSSSFKYRYLRMLNLHYLFNKKENVLTRYMKFICSFTSLTRLWYLFLPIINLLNFKNWIVGSIIKKIEIPNEIKAFLINEKKIDLILMPSSGLDPITLILDRISKLNKSKKAVLINNWDNLSSKGSFWYKPEFLGVWGYQMKEHAANIQNIPKKNIFITGSPTYTKYFQIRNKKIISPYKCKYFLFFGPALPFDELRVLDNLDKILTNNKKIFKSIKIVYRPHPFRQHRASEDNFFKKKYKNIILDNQSKTYYKKNKSSFYPALKYYPALIQNSELVIAPLSTMLLESLIFYKKILIIDHEDDYHFTTPKRNLKNFEHLKIIKNNKLFYFSRNLKDMENALIKCFRENKRKKKEIDNLRENILINSLNYKNLLSNAIEKIK
tara:strand:- start:1800 stop:3170 length:1371 start_codon:yes stop_codon:yes gene_type:complete